MRGVYTRKSAERRFFDHVKFDDGCCEWIGCKSQSGFWYGILRVGGKNVPAHRFSWELFNGPIPKGICVLHTCDNPACVKPTHLFLGTQSDNMKDMSTKGRNPGPSPHKNNWREIANSLGSLRKIGKECGISHAAVMRYRKRLSREVCFGDC